MVLKAEAFEDRREVAITLYEINRELNHINGTEQPSWTELPKRSKDVWYHIAKGLLMYYDMEEKDD